MKHKFKEKSPVQLIISLYTDRVLPFYKFYVLLILYYPNDFLRPFHH